MVKWLAFRKQTRLSKGRQEQVKAYAEGVVERQSWLQATLYPQQTASFPKPVKVKAPGDAEEVSQRLRKVWRLDDAPIDSLVEAVEDKGGFVVEYPDTGVEFDGLSGRADGRPVIVVNTDTTVNRRRYNVAHELGHVLTDCPRLSEKEQEAVAHRFAAALLVPADVARQELGEKRRHLAFTELGVLKEKYGLSMQASGSAAPRTWRSFPRASTSRCVSSSAAKDGGRGSRSSTTGTRCPSGSSRWPCAPSPRASSVPTRPTASARGVAPIPWPSSARWRILP